MQLHLSYVGCPRIPPFLFCFLLANFSLFSFASYLSTCWSQTELDNYSLWLSFSTIHHLLSGGGGQFCGLLSASLSLLSDLLLAPHMLPYPLPCWFLLPCCSLGSQGSQVSLLLLSLGPSYFSSTSFMCSVNFLIAKMPGIPQGPYSVRAKIPSLIPSLAWEQKLEVVRQRVLQFRWKSLTGIDVTGSCRFCVEDTLPLPPHVLVLFSYSAYF